MPACEASAATIASMTESLKVSVWRGTRRAGGFARYDVPRQREPDRARRRHPHPAPSRSLARLSLRLPRRHVRFVRDDRQRHARWTCRTHVAQVAEGRPRSRSRRSRTCRWSRISSPTCASSSTSGRARRAVQGTATRHDDFAAWRPSRAARIAADAGIECIGCGVCYAVVRRGGVATATISGPAALNRAWTLVNDVRDVAQARAAARRRRRRRLPLLPHAGLVHRALSEADRADRRHRRLEARDARVALRGER